MPLSVAPPTLGTADSCRTRSYIARTTEVSDLFLFESKGPKPFHAWTKNVMNKSTEKLQHWNKLHGVPNTTVCLSLSSWYHFIRTSLCCGKRRDLQTCGKVRSTKALFPMQKHTFIVKGLWSRDWAADNIATEQTSHQAERSSSPDRFMWHFPGTNQYRGRPTGVIRFPFVSRHRTNPFLSLNQQNRGR